MMKLTEAILLKYADKQLSIEEAEDVEKLLAHDEDAKKQLALIQESGLALETLSVSQEEIDAEQALKARLFSGELSGNNNAANDEKEISRSQKSEASAALFATSGWGLGKVAAVLTVLMGTAYVGYYAGTASLSAEDVQMARLPVWVARVVDYHTLYDRETVAGAVASPAQVAHLTSQFSGLLARDISIPNLERGDLEFKRGQVLKFEGEEIIQLAYLPMQSGKPVALCFRVSGGQNTEASYTQIRGLGVARWRHDGIEYILLGEQNDAQLVMATNLARSQIAQS